MESPRRFRSRSNSFQDCELSRTPSIQANELLLALRRCTNDDQQALRIVLEAGLHVDAVDPEIDIALAERSRLLQRVCSSDQASLSREMVEAESPPASLPSNASSASSKSPVDTPLR
jgi:hypothetical protein